MNLIETFRIAIDSLLINRLRSLLTTLGIIIGVGAVIALVSLGRGVEDYISTLLTDLGATVLDISSTTPESSTRTRVEPLTTVEAEALENPAIAPSIRQVGYSYVLRGTVVAGSERTDTNITGITANYADIVGWGLQYGNFISVDDIESNARVAVVGLDVVESLFADRDFNAVGQKIRINDRVFTIIGVMEQRGGTFASEDAVVFVPVTTAQTRLDSARTRDGGYQVSQIHIDVINEELIDQAREQIYAYLDEVHDVLQVDERDYEIESDAGLVQTINGITGTLTVFLTMIAGISLLVGGIGIMNIMLVSVTERTREIGLRKSVGAQSQDILTQFLVESVVLSLIGGIVGIIVGAVAAQIGTQLVPQLTLSLQADAIILATGVSTLVGIFFGYYPAQRAASMKPIDALRFE